MWPQIFLLGLTNPFSYPMSSLPSNMQQWQIAQEVYCSCSGIWKKHGKHPPKECEVQFQFISVISNQSFPFCKFCVSLASFACVSSCICNIRSNKEQFCLDLLSFFVCLFHLYSVYQMDHIFSFEEGHLLLLFP